MPELDPEVDNAVREGLGVIDHIHSKLHDLPVHFEVHIPCALYYICLQHSAGAMLLLKNMCHAPAFALARPIFETFVRALWFYSAATPEQKAAAAEDNFPRLSRLIDALRDVPDTGPIIRRFNDISRLHSFTHGGTAQILQHMDERTLEAHFSKNMQMALVEWGTGLSIAAGIQFAAVSGAPDVGVDLYRTLPERYRSAQGG
jgi:hypothetical protein